MPEQDCVQTFESTTEGFSEPFVAAHPTDLSVFAVGIHVRPRTFITEGDEQAMWGMALMVTEDGGQTFQRHDVSFPPATLEGPSVRIMSDPTFAFNPDGSIDLVGIVIERRADFLPPTRGLVKELDGSVAQVFHTRWSDGAFTPSALIKPDERQQDRPWLLRHPATGIVYVAWQTEGTAPSTTTVAWLAGGQWEILDPALEPACFSTGPIIADHTGIFFSCTDYESGYVEVWSFEPGAVPSQSASFPLMYEGNTRSFLAAGGVRTYLVIEAFSGGQDRGLTSATIYRMDADSWSPPLDLATTLDMDTAFVTWAVGDEWGRLQALVRSTTETDDGNTYELRHVAIDPLEDPWMETLDQWSDPAVRSLATNTPDHDFESLAVRPDGSLILAWGRVTDGRQSADGTIRIVAVH